MCTLPSPTATGSRKAPFFFLRAHFIIFIFIASAIFYFQKRPTRVQPTSVQEEPTSESFPVVKLPPLIWKKPISDEPLSFWTIKVRGRLGNQMSEYATLYTLAKMNGRPAFISEEMYGTLAPIFKISLPVLHRALEKWIPWHNYLLNDWMEERYRHISSNFVCFNGFTTSWTFYHHLRPEILREFSLHEHLHEEAQAFLWGLQADRGQPCTFVGVHVRRGDYVHYMPYLWKGVVADPNYLRQAMDWFQARYDFPVFVVTSDDMAWCRENINASFGDVVFAGHGKEHLPTQDFALLTQCNHTIMTIGTFGIWVAYLAGGETIYLANYTLPDSPFLTVFKPEAAFLPEWVGIPADLSPLLKN
ncbi:galactoside alpha-(1,2)-fucosyltransferase 2-like [Perognathus longimembris pacificus]|uniref:galactoside alpha-(1,2)-fucosyltransferase 2-like n=1 Tax=Perognathus longimembris pacificus TaxID=214514 RepID=UPI0020186903|nr:galactoside alpha-(1,2)-fucosyltransferase 2-like [Perognathus longimembris pacificus]